MTHVNIFLIWVRPQKDNSMGFDYCFDKLHKDDTIPFILYSVLNEENGFNLPKEPIEDPIIDNYHPIRVIIHSAEDTLKGQASESQDVFNQMFLRDENDLNLYIENEDPKKNKKFEGIKVPIIHLTLSDLFVESLFGIDPLPNPVPRSYMIMDNSIWNYLVPIADSFYIHDLVYYRQLKEDDKIVERNKAKRGYQESFKHAVRSIYNNYQKNLYRLKVAQEYADLNARLVEQSYLSGAHASGVSPFIFHSETTAKQLVQREFRLKEDTTKFPFDKGNKYDVGSIMDLICKYKWRILLLDDKAIKPMDTKPNYPDLDNSEGSWNCKLEILRNILEHQLGMEEQVSFGPSCKEKQETVMSKTNEKTKIYIEYAQNIKEAKDALKEKKYDLVLIDYLLNQTDGTHYGYELLDEIWNDQQQIKKGEKDLLYKVSPHRSQRLYCMFISAYSYAVHDRLLAEGLNQSEKYWFINTGACPTNTPQLFLYNLLKLMEKRLDDSGILKLSPNKIYNLIYKIYLPKGQDVKGDSVRKRAYALYQKVLSLQYHYRNILKDVEIPFGQNANDFDTKGSVLMTNYIQKKINLGGMLEHLTQLVHLTAFGTIRQWPEMWEEYIYFKAQFEKQLKEDNDAENVDCMQLFSNIERYILELKSQQR